jgi:hypothetical protein
MALAYGETIAQKPEILRKKCKKVEHIDIMKKSVLS